MVTFVCWIAFECGRLSATTVSLAAVRASDVVITMGCGDECPFYPGTRYLDWQLDDPAGQGIDAVGMRLGTALRIRIVAADLLTRGHEIASNCAAHDA